MTTTAAGQPTGGSFPWRQPLSADWAARFAEIEAVVRGGGAPDYTLTKATVNQQLGTREQLKVERLARRMAEDSRAGGSFEPFKLGLLGSRTLSYISSPLRAAGLARGLLVSPLEAPYDSVASFAFSPANCFGQSLDALLVILDEAAFASKRPLLDAKAEDDAVREADALVSSIAEAARAKTGCLAVVATLPAPLQIASAEIATPGSSARFRLRVNMMLADGAMRGKWLIWDQAALAARLGLERWLDPVSYHAAKTPFSIHACVLAADNISALLAAMKGKTARAIVLDLDNTLWGGVIGDDGVAGIKLGQNSVEGESFIAFQHFLLGLRERGIVLSVSSKNTDMVAREPFRVHPEMVLKEEHIAVFQANWNDKATNIRAVAGTLSLGLESLVFIDDNPAERERVRQELPLVSTIEVGEDPSFFIERVTHSGLFDHIPLTADDLSRANSYGGRAAAATIRTQIGNYDEYLASLQMQMVISPFDDVGRARIVQLINKSNQFNLTTRRYNDEEVRQIQNDPNKIAWQVQLKDKFANHGMIGVVIVRKDDMEWEIDSWLQSCRVLERGVEHGIMNTLVNEALTTGIERIRAQYIPSGRNGMVADFYKRLGFEAVGETHSGAVEFACALSGYEPHRVFVDVDRL
jgi:FkbH-like protein